MRLIPLLLSLVAMLVVSIPAAAADKLTVLVWEEFIAPTTLTTLLKADGIDVEQVTFTSDDERLAILEKQAGKIDLVVGDTTAQSRLRREKLIERIDFTRIPNAKHLTSRIDTSSRYGLPYLWGHTGIAWRTDLVRKPLKTYADLFNLAKKNPGKVGLVNNPHEALMASLFAFSQPPYALLSPVEVAAADQLLRPHLANLVLADSELDEKSPLVTGKLIATQAYNGDIAYLRDTYKVPLAFAIPEPGCMVWSESFMLLKSAPHKDAAYRFLDAINKPALAGRNAEEVRYATVNAAGLAQVSAAFRDDPVIRPTLKGLDNCYFYRELDRATAGALEKVKLD